MFTLPYMLLFAYLLGSIPTSVWVSKLVFHKDIRNYGSGNAGATNSFRYLGAKWAGFILLVDIFKGLLAVKLLNLLPSEAQNSLWGHLNNQLLLGMAAVLGHVFPVLQAFVGARALQLFRSNNCHRLAVRTNYAWSLCFGLCFMSLCSNCFNVWKFSLYFEHDFIKYA